MSVSIEEGARRFRAWHLGIFGAFRSGLDSAAEAWKALAQAEARTRGGNRPGRQGRRMWQSIVREPARLQPPSGHGQDTVRVGSSLSMDGQTWWVTLRAGGRDVKHARIQELGGTTRPHEIRARRARMLSFYWPKVGHRVAFPRVQHPGSKIPARPYMGGRVAERAAPVMMSKVLASQVDWARTSGVL